MNLLLHIDNFRLACLLECAYEGALDRWCQSIKTFESREPVTHKDIAKDEEKFFWPLHQGGKWILVDRITGNRHALTKYELQRGIQLIADLAPTDFSALLCDDHHAHDREIADMLVQLAVFGEIRYAAPSATQRHRTPHPP